MDIYQGFEIDSLGGIKKVKLTAAPGTGLPDAFSPEAFESLESVYAMIPATVCERCGSCCANNKVLCYTVEFFHIIDYLRRERKELLPGLKAELGARLMQREQKHHAPRLPCVFFNAEPGSCEIYPFRPLVCRTFGLGRVISHAPQCAPGHTPACEKLKWLKPESTLPCRDLTMAYREIRSLSPYFVNEQIEFLARAHALEVWLTWHLLRPGDPTIFELFDSY